jgi:hypothetical protein
MTPRTQARPDGSERPPTTAGTRRLAPGGPRGARLRQLPLPVLLGLMLVGGLCALLALNTASAAQELRQRSLTESNAALSDQQQQLMRDLAAKQAPASLAAAAAALGLVPNPNPAFLRLNADGSVTVLGSPAPASLAPRPVTPKPTATPSPRATPSKSAANPTASSAGTSKPASSSTGTSKPTTSSTASPATRPGPSTPAGTSARPTAPVVTVTVTRPAPTTTPSTRPSPTKSTAPGGH